MSSSLSYQTMSVGSTWDEVGQGKFIALMATLLFHAAIATFLLFSWTNSIPKSAETKSMQIHMLQLPKPVTPQPVIQPPKPKPIEPVQQKKQVKPKPVEKKEFAFKRVDKPKPKVEPKPKSKPKQKPEVKKVPESVKPVVKSEPVEQPVISQPVKQVASTADRQQQIMATASATQAEKAFDISQYHPVDKQAPDYPRKALRKGIEGDCTVQYTVNTAGHVENPKVIGQCHPSFIKPSLEAAKTFRYAPRLINGKAVPVPNVRNTFEYRIH